MLVLPPITHKEILVVRDLHKTVGFLCKTMFGGIVERTHIVN